MATLLFSAVGNALGGPIGGVVGALVGRQVDSAIMGGGRQGPKLKELAATTSSYGSPLPRHFGRMRVPGSIIWATDLVEHRESQGGKNRPSVTAYSYTASFAVALGSRPIEDVGRIWADGNLLRGGAGDLKTGGEMRIYRGHGDQQPDPLIAEIEGADRCPAYRSLAYVVFEDLELGDFFNRIPALTFEVIADESGFSLQDLLGGVVEDVDGAVPLEGIAGLSVEGPLVDTLELLDPFYPMSADAGGGPLTIARDRLQGAPIELPEGAVSVGDGDFGGLSGFARKRLPTPPQPPAILRYYDIDRDYLPGLQRATGRAHAGGPRTIELAAALRAGDARLMVERSARRADWAREQLAWRTATLDTAIAPGAIVTVPGYSGRWRVSDWEWRESGVEITLLRTVPAGADPLSLQPVDPGRINRVPDLPAPPTTLVAFELPWDGTGNGDARRPFAAVSSSGANWSGAALFADHGDGALLPLGPSGRIRSIVGLAQDVLAPASPLLVDRSASVIVQLLDQEMRLSDATGRALAIGANRALLGEEIIQFGRAVPLGDGRWLLRSLLRGRGGTEAAVASHRTGEPFVLLDAAPVALDPATVGVVAETQIVAVGHGDDEAVSSAIALQGIGLRPSSPVHPRARRLTDGSLALHWTRRARGAWAWSDGVDVPLHEQSERYQVTFELAGAPVALWEVEEPRLILPPSVLAELIATPAGEFHVRQQGTYALSEPLRLAALS